MTVKEEAKVEEGFPIIHLQLHLPSHLMCIIEAKIDALKL